jgi:hypothetical protein
VKPVWNIICSYVLRSGMRCGERIVRRNRILAIGSNESLRNSTRSSLESSSYAAIAFESAEAFGGGSEYFPFWRMQHFPFTPTRLFEQGEE